MQDIKTNKSIALCQKRREFASLIYQFEIVDKVNNLTLNPAGSGINSVKGLKTVLGSCYA
jgi:hypothetical protein